MRISNSKWNLYTAANPTLRQFDEIIRKTKHFKIFQNSVTTLWKNQKFTLTNKISSNQLLSNFFSKTVTFTKFLPKMRESEFLEFPQCVFHTV